MKVSIIMPVYNSEAFLNNAIDSILNQSYKEFELILVEDASSDNSPTICDEYSKKDARVIVHHSCKNNGICKTRNIGLSIATGDYIAFCDDDDIFCEKLLEDNMKLLMEYNADMVKYGRKLVDILSDGSVVRTKETEFEKLSVLSENDMYSDYHQIRKAKYMMNIWNGIYKKSIIDEFNLKFDETMLFGSEDAEFSYRFYINSNICIFNPLNYYVHYRRNNFSTSRKFSANKIDSLVKTAQSESLVWDKVANKHMISEFKLEYLKIIITTQLLHKKCTMSYKQKITCLEKLCENSILQLNRNISKNYYGNKLDIVMSNLILKKKYNLLLILYSIYFRFKGENWT